MQWKCNIYIFYDRGLWPGFTSDQIADLPSNIFFEIVKTLESDVFLHITRTKTFIII